MKAIRASLATAVLAFSAGVHAEFTLEGSLFSQIGTEHDVDPLLLYSVALTESATGKGQGRIGPHPYVFRTDAGPRFFQTLAEAEASLADALLVTDNVDIGLMQINLKWHPQDNPLLLLKPDHNLAVAIEILKTSMASTDDPVLGVGRYHQWADENLARWYGETVWKTYSNLLQMHVFSGAQ